MRGRLGRGVGGGVGGGVGEELGEKLGRSGGGVGGGGGGGRSGGDTRLQFLPDCKIFLNIFSNQDFTVFGLQNT